MTLNNKIKILSEQVTKSGKKVPDLSGKKVPDLSGKKVPITTIPDDIKNKFREVTLTGDDLKNGKTVGPGRRGDIVGKIQDLLKKAAADLGKPEIAQFSKDGTIDNLYGQRTYEAVKAFQRAKGDPKPDGIVGPNTWSALNGGTYKVKSSSSGGSSSGGSSGGVMRDPIGDLNYHDCSTKDFPYEFGCIHPKIGEMRKCLGLADPESNKYGPEMVRTLENMGFTYVMESHRGITEYIYKRVLALCDTDLKK